MKNSTKLLALAALVAGISFGTTNIVLAEEAPTCEDCNKIEERLEELTEEDMKTAEMIAEVLIETAERANDDAEDTEEAA